MYISCVVYCVFCNRVTKMLHVTKLLDEMYNKVDVWIPMINIRRMGSYSHQFMNNNVPFSFSFLKVDEAPCVT